MIINLKTSAASDHSQRVQITIAERIPANIEGPCVVDCEFKVRREDNYYLLTLVANSKLTMICQRCLHEYPYDYSNNTVLAICESDEQAVKLMSQYECITSQNNQVNLNDLLTDDLYLYTPENHIDLEDCDKVVNGFIITNSTH